MRLGDQVLIIGGNHQGARGVIVGFRGAGANERAEVRLGLDSRNCTFNVSLNDLEEIL